MCIYIYTKVHNQYIVQNIKPIESSQDPIPTQLHLAIKKCQWHLRDILLLRNHLA